MTADGRFSVYGKMTAKAGQRDELVARLADLLRLDTPGLEWCSVNTTLEDPDTVWITEIWSDKATHDTETRSEAVVAATARLMELVAAPPEGCYGRVAHLHDVHTG
ncbi:antibiotic biosynthesis monooxygenase family protein [Actinocatenispora sera]|uniref:putative quinol monooxygenase n=1 Tax=Actinocatenispora sera TaxID=390989 RepID=UPI0033F55978